MSETSNNKSRYTFYATIAASQPDGPGCYHIEVSASDRFEAENEARRRVHERTEGRWAFMYDRLLDVHRLDRRVIGSL